jgi:hypothetical protein
MKLATSHTQAKIINIVPIDPSNASSSGLIHSSILLTFFLRGVLASIQIIPNSKFLSRGINGLIA